MYDSVLITLVQTMYFDNRQALHRIRSSGIGTRTPYHILEQPCDHSIIHIYNSILIKLQTMYFDNIQNMYSDNRHAPFEWGQVWSKPRSTYEILEQYCNHSITHMYDSIMMKPGLNYDHLDKTHTMFDI